MWKLHENEKDIRKASYELIGQIYEISQLREKHVGVLTAELDASLLKLDWYAFLIKSQQFYLSHWLLSRVLNRITDDCQKLAGESPFWKKLKGLFSTDDVKGQIVELKDQINNVQTQFLVCSLRYYMELPIYR